MLAVVGGLLFGGAAYGQMGEKPLGATAQVLPQYLKDAGVVERLNQPLPLSAQFVDESGKTGGVWDVLP